MGIISSALCFKGQARQGGCSRMTLEQSTATPLDGIRDLDLYRQAPHPRLHTRRPSSEPGV